MQRRQRAVVKVAERRPAAANKILLPWAAAQLAFFLLVTVFSLLVPASAQISPGPLSRAHKELNGATRCTSCHKLGGEATLKCLECHTEIASRVAAKRGLHASYGILAGSTQECAHCHSDHNGEDFPLIKWDTAGSAFDHTKTGYALEGKHAQLACSRCHNAGRVSATQGTNIRVSDLNKTFLGLSQSCASCHKDVHNGRLGQTCQQCHSFNGWKDIAHFDHAKTRFPLSGLHAQVSCQRCHTPGQDHQPRYAGLAFSRCSDCHADPHKGSFSQGCQACHNTGGWKRVSVQSISERYDHSKTQYPLLGRHQMVECSQCHEKGDFKKPLAFEKCTDCHRPDPHGGQFAKRTDGGECAACHSVRGFKPSLYGVKEHSSSAYPLESKHATIQCSQCHQPRGKDTQYRIKFSLCTDCHKDEHRGQFAATPYQNRCERCHDLKGYRPSTFTLAKHKETRFPLAGGHIATPCGDCHKAPTFKELKPTAQFRFADISCTACHSDPHKGVFKDRMLEASSQGTPVGCVACHSTASWQDLQRFDHSRTSFPLLGAHRSTPCADCHKPLSPQAKPVNVDFKAAPRACEQCHENVHGPQFLKADRSTPCAQCHNTIRWKPSVFDHEKGTSFSLRGAHQNVRCASCHNVIRLIGSKSVLFYKPTPTKCAACHGAGTS